MGRKNKSTDSTATAPPQTAGAAVASPPEKAEPKAKAEPKTEPAPQPKAKGEAKAKAKAEAKPEAPPKAKAEAKPKSEAKPKAEPKAKADAKGAPAAKADPKKGDAKAKAAANAEPKAEPKSKAKAGAAKAAPAPPAPAPVPEPQEMEMEAVVRKKKRSRKKAEAEELAPEPEDITFQNDKEDLANSERIRSSYDDRNNNLLEKIRKDFDALPDLTKMKQDDEAMKEATSQRERLTRIMNDIDETLNTVRIPKPKVLNVGKIMEQMRELRMCKNDSMDSFTDSTKSAMLMDVENSLSKALAFESFKCFQADMTKLKEQCEEKLKANEVIIKAVRSTSNQKRLVQRVANSKGVNPEELNEKDIISMSVDLAPEVTSVSFLYQRKYEKQFGVVIDRPDGAPSKGAGKGVTRSLIVRGLEGEVSACTAALKQLDLSERRVLNVTPKQAAAIMGPQQTNARSIESQFPGVFLNSEKNQVTVYGPGKQVTACLKHVEGITVEEPQVTVLPPLNINKDRARALIGPGGQNVQRIESETNTQIKVRNVRKDSRAGGPELTDDDGLATVKITGDKANQDKARAAIEAFLKSLAVVLVEAEPEVITRLQATEAPRKGKGKGKTDGASPTATKQSKFAEFREQSGLTVLQKPNGILLVGESDTVKKWETVLKECIQAEKSVVAITADQAKLWTTERLEEVSKAGGATVTLGSRGRDKVLEIDGSTDAARDKVIAAIQEVHTKLGSQETIENLEQNAFRALSVGKGAGRNSDRVKELEAQHQVSIDVDRRAKAVRITGEKNAVAEAKSAVESLITSASNKVSREVDIEWDEGRIVIGKGGNTVKHIKSTTGLEDLQIEDGETKKIVKLYGTKESVDAAESMVQEVLAKAKEPKENNNHRVERTSVSSDSSGKGKEERAGGYGGNGKSASSSSHAGANNSGASASAGAERAEPKRSRAAAPPPKQASVNLECKDLFPSLGGESNSRSKRRPKGTAWKTVEEDDEEEAVKAVAAAEEAEET